MSERISELSEAMVVQWISSNDSSDSDGYERSIIFDVHTIPDGTVIPWGRYTHFISFYILYIYTHLNARNNTNARELWCYIHPSDLMEVVVQLFLSTLWAKDI